MARVSFLRICMASAVSAKAWNAQRSLARPPVKCLKSSCVFSRSGVAAGRGAQCATLEAASGLRRPQSRISMAPDGWLRSLFRKREPPPDGVGTQERTRLGRTPIVSRTVSLGVTSGRDERDGNMSITVWEVERPSDLIQMMWTAVADPGRGFGDPYGIVMWPGSILASRELVRRCEEVRDKQVLVLGSGTGLEAQTAALLGAARVVALDINKLTLRLLEYGAERAGCGDAVEGRVFDLFSDEPLPRCDVAVAADLVYNENLARCVGGRCRELMSRDDPVKLIVTVSHLRGDFFNPLLEEVNHGRGAKGEPPLISWEEHNLGNVRGAGILGGVPNDQTYENVKARKITSGWAHE